MTVLAIIIAGFVVVAVLRRENGDAVAAPESTANSLRRFFQYALLFGVLMLVLYGVSRLVGQALNVLATREPAVRTELAAGLAYTIIGAPVLAGLVRWTRAILSHPDSGEAEQTTRAWRIYLTVASYISLTVGVVNAVEFFDELFDGAFDGQSMATAVLWGLSWVVHWRISTTYVSSLNFERALGATFGLAIAAGTTGAIVGVAARELYQSIFGPHGLRTSYAAELIDQLPLVLAGSLVWWWYWLRRTGEQDSSIWRDVYILLVGVFAGFAALIGTAAFVLYEVAVWLVGEPETAVATEHFGWLPAAFATAMVGGATWIYHSRIRRHEDDQRTEVARIYDYGIAGISLVTAATGLALVIVALFESFGPATIGGSGGTGRNTLLAAVTALAVGAPMWWYYWSVIERHRRAEPLAEIPSGTRRSYVFALFGIGGIVALVSAIVGSLTFLNDLFDETLSLETLYEMRWSMALVVTTGAVGGFHWTVYRSDRELDLGPRAPIEHVVVVSTDEGLIDGIGAGLDVRVTWIRPVDTTLDGSPDGVKTAQVDVDALVAQIAQSEHREVLVDPAAAVPIRPIEMSP